MSALEQCSKVLLLVVAGAAASPRAGHAQTPPALEHPESVVVRLADTELGVAVQSLARYLDRPVVFGGLGAQRITLEMPAPIPRGEVLGVLRGLLESQGFELVADSGGVYAVRQRSPSSRDRERLGQQVQTATPPPELFVIRLKHARAADVAATVSALYCRPAALGEVGERPRTLTEALAQNRLPVQAPPPQAVASVAGRPAALAGDVVIVPDAATNALLIRASRDDFELIQAAVQQLDVRPLQVLIEVLIVEARRDRQFAYGLGASLADREIPGTGGTLIAGETQGLGLGDLAVRVMQIGGMELSAVLEAAAARGDATIVSRPVVVTANNERAEILVGSQRPFVQVSRSLPTDTPSRDQVVQYKDVGTALNVRPTVDEGGYVMLDLSQEVNAATTETAFDAPVISTRSLRTRLLVKDGQAVVLGGLVDRQRDATRSGVPVLSGIPVIGGLFGRHSNRTIETELFLFITPRVIRDDEDAHRISAPLLERAEKRVKP